MNCKNCEWARRACCGDGYVACGWWSAGVYRSFLPAEITKDKRDSLMLESGLGGIWEGWAYLKRWPEDQDGDGTVSTGVITNYSIIVRENDVCREWKEREV